MSFRDKMKVGVSNAEYKLLIALSRAGLTQSLGITTQKPIHLLDPCPEYPHGLDTKPDYRSDMVQWVGFLDNVKLHKGSRMEKDEVKDDLLRGMGWRVSRWPYSPPLSDRRLGEIVEEVRRLKA